MFRPIKKKQGEEGKTLVGFFVLFCFFRGQNNETQNSLNCFKFVLFYNSLIGEQTQKLKI